MLRFDAAIARFAVTQGRNLKMTDFMPWPKKEPEPASPEEVFAFLKGMVRKKDS